MNDDFRDLLQALLRVGARFLVIGAHAMAVHGVPRATGDLDLWIRPDAANADHVWEALTSFGAPVRGLDLSREDLATPGIVVQIGLPPRRIDLLTKVSGLDFDDAWNNRVSHRVGSHDVPFLSREDLVRNKRATGRKKDLADLEILEQGDDRK
jgi:hypothetical protein